VPTDPTLRLRKTVPEGSLIFADSRMGAALECYLGRDQFDTKRFGPANFWESDAGHYCVIGSPLWDPKPTILADEVERLIHVYRLPPGQPVWAVHLGPVRSPSAELNQRFRGAVLQRQFGDLSLFEIWPGERPEASVSRSGAPSHSLDPRRSRRRGFA